MTIVMNMEDDADDADGNEARTIMNGNHNEECAHAASLGFVVGRKSFCEGMFP